MHNISKKKDFAGCLLNKLFIVSASGIISGRDKGGTSFGKNCRRRPTQKETS